MEKNSLVLIIHNVRSAHNVGSLFRTADGAGIQEVFLTGYTSVPPKEDAVYFTDAEKSFKKTALGAEKYVVWQKQDPLRKVIMMFKKRGYEIVALEQHGRSTDYRKYVPGVRVALIVGNEVRGIDAKILKQCDTIIEIPMYGEKKSLNVSVAGGIALYQIKGTMKKMG